MARIPETLRITYAPVGQEPISIDIPRTRHSDEASRKDGRAIAEAIMQLKPGVNEFNTTDIEVERVDGDRSSMLHGWKERAEKPFEKAARALTHSSVLRTSELQEVRDAALQEGRDMQQRNRRRRHADPLFVPGRKRAQFVAWNPLFSTTRVERIGSALANMALSEVDVKVDKIGIGKLAIPFKTPYERTLHLENPFLTPGLGKDNRDMVRELSPEQSIDDMQNYLSGLLRRMQDRELDPADIVHGVGKTIVDIVERHQSGLSGIFLTLAQAELPAIREAIEAVFNVESITSADKGASKFALLAYSEADDRALARRVAKQKQNQPTHTEIVNENPSLAKRTLSHVEEQLKAQFDWRPSAIRRRLRDAMTTARHRLVWYPANVLADQLDRRSERQDEVALAYVKTVLTATGGSEAFQSYKTALATAFSRALTANRTEAETSMRKLSGESSTLEQTIENELMTKIPPYWQDVIRKGLAALEGKKADLPESYRASLKTLKEHETTDSYLDYLRFLYPLTVQYSSEDATNPLAGKDKNLKALRELWRQAREYTEYIDTVREAAHQVLTPQTTNAETA